MCMNIGDNRSSSGRLQFLCVPACALFPNRHQKTFDMVFSTQGAGLSIVTHPRHDAPRCLCRASAYSGKWYMAAIRLQQGPVTYLAALGVPVGGALLIRGLDTHIFSAL